MSWLVDLFSQPTYLQAVLILSIVCALGLALGRIKIKGVSLGVTFVFFAGILMGEFADRHGIVVDRSMISLAQNFGLILFVYALGVQVGPAFFPSLRKGGVKLNLYGLLLMALTTAAAIGIYAFTRVGLSDSMGLLCGAATNTPMLGAAQQSLLDVFPDRIDEANGMATACAVAYPFGVIGVLICMIVLRFASRNEPQAANDSAGDSYVAEFHVSNPAVFNLPIGQLHTLTPKNIIISRIYKNGKVQIPSSTTILEKNDHLLCVLNKDSVDAFRVVFGETDAVDWNRPDIDWNKIDNSNLVSKHVLVTKEAVNGVKLGSLKLRNQFDINVTRVNRAGITLVAYPNLHLQIGDRLTVVGTEAAIKKVGEILGNEEKVLNTPNLVAIFLGIFLGVIIGSIPFFVPGMKLPVKLGIAGGPIVVGILFGALGPRFKLYTYTTRSANLMLRQMGIVVYLACLGFSAGAGFFETVLSMQGLSWILISLFIAIVPVLITGWIASRWGKLDYAQNAGMLCAAMANPMALTYANANADDEKASEAYATVYPLSMFIRVISAQMLMLFLL
ncbi:MAG: putative transporter [Bacteroidales bacterium]|nr:putative transporter [Bacteroidales bacterium]